MNTFEHIDRLVEKQVRSYLRPNKVVVILGSRRVGKTVLIKKILSESLRGSKFLIIDEAQKIPDIGMALKLMVDEIDDLKIMITGSSAFDVENYTGEPLTGRKMTFKLFGISEQELEGRFTIVEEKDALYDRLMLYDRLIYGSYPEVLQIDSKNEKHLYLKELLNSYLLKDILAFETIRNSSKIIDLLRLIAFLKIDSFSSGQ